MIASHADLLAAYDQGRHHTQRFIKTVNGQNIDGRWQDWAMQAGQPAYDARIGPVNTRVPVVASKNDAIWFPEMPAGMERRLHSLTLRPLASGLGQASLDFVLYDLVAYYPLIDGDSTDPQDFDNTLPLPRYTNGEGLRLVMVNHVSPAVAAGRMLLEVTDTTGAAQTLDVLVPNNGINSACNGIDTVAASTIAGFCLPLPSVQRVDRLTYSVPPGGLHCLYLIKPLAQFAHYHDALVVSLLEKHAIEVDFARKDGWRLPVIHDGAHLGFFYRGKGSSRSNTLFGDMTFIWG